MLLFKGFSIIIIWYNCAQRMMAYVEVISNLKCETFNYLQQSVTRPRNEIETSNFHDNINQIFFYCPHQVTIYDLA